MIHKDNLEQILEDIEILSREVHENNIMLKQIINIINSYILNHHSENNNDFIRNILANLISNGLDFRR